MEIDNQEQVTVMERIKARLGKIRNAIAGVGEEAQRLGKEDSRRIVHAFKVGLAIAAVSLLYYFDFFFDGFGVNAMWAVMTVVVVFEFSVGATLGKGVNRAIATLLGGALGVAAHDSASFTGDKIQVIVLGLSVFFIAVAATFCRFFPKMRARYDYGVVIFILTFSLISVSGYRDDEVWDMAYGRLTTILVGGCATVLVCTLVCPVWAGEDLHKLTASNIQELGTFLEVFGRVYFQEEAKDDKNRVLLNDYKTVLNSKGVEDSLVNFAKWEPRHGKFRYRHPWDQYLKIGSLTRECAYKIDALNSYLNSDVQTPLELRTKIEEACKKIISESSSALRELAMGIQTMTCSPSRDAHVVNAKSAAAKLKALMRAGPWPHTDFLDIVPAVAVASLLIEVVWCTVKIDEAVGELASSARFKKLDRRLNRELSLEKMQRTPSIQASHINILVE
ncbi:aluminum-activated malate transporter 2-like [Salvia miltiorrhiza]|uniref:aluminum-activated malate transporter 2-like n=1 Tax=Salvia miltiorrhiza TaxID=226208 RepID=UPI0025ACDC1F|nr:aluminum-activated malate transporter 2-like [Salvia miltiorrhiza]